MVLPGSGRTHSTIAWISARGVKYCPAPDLVSSAFFSSKPFVDVALDVGVHAHPLHLVDHVDQAVELGRVLNLVLRLGEDLAQHVLALAEFAQQLDVMRFQLRSALCFQDRPSVFVGMPTSRL